MKRYLILTGIAAAAIVAAAPALAKPVGGGHGGGMGGGWGAGGSHGGMVGSSGGWGAGGFSRNGGFITGTATRIHSNRSDTGTSLRAGSGIGRVKLTGVSSGMTVVDSGGVAVGTVTNVFTKGNGSIRAVQVTLADGRIVTLAPSSLTLDDSTLTTTSLVSTIKSQGAAHANINGLVNASPNSALAVAGVTTLTSLATGLTVNNSAGAPIGTVSELFTNRSGQVVGIRVALLDGSTAIIPATTLSMDGTFVVTNSTQF